MATMGWAAVLAKGTCGGGLDVAIGGLEATGAAGAVRYGWGPKKEAGGDGGGGGGAGGVGGVGGFGGGGGVEG